MLSFCVESAGAELQIQGNWVHVQASLQSLKSQIVRLDLVTEQVTPDIQLHGWLALLIPSNSHVVQGSMVFIVTEFHKTTQG